MLILKWFLWRRWMSDGDFSCDWSMLQCKALNFAGCRDHLIIYRDMRNILQRIKAKNSKQGEE